MLYSKLLAMGQSHADIVKRLRTTDQVLVRLYEATHRFLHMTINTVDNTPPQDKIYRVEITNNAVEVVCLGLDSVDSDANAYYDSMGKGQAICAVYVQMRWSHANRWWRRT